MCCCCFPVIGRGMRQVAQLVLVFIRELIAGNTRDLIVGCLVRTSESFLCRLVSYFSPLLVRCISSRKVSGVRVQVVLLCELRQALAQHLAAVTSVCVRRADRPVVLRHLLPVIIDTVTRPRNVLTACSLSDGFRVLAAGRELTGAVAGLVFGVANLNSGFIC